MQVELAKLRSLERGWCKSLKYLFPQTLAQTLESLVKITIDHCESLEYLIMECSEIEEEEEEEEEVPKRRNPCCWPKLETLQIKKCKSLKYLFPPILAQTLESLEKLTIDDCESLEYLIMELDQVPNRRNPCCWPKLNTLKIGKCEKLKYLFPITWAQGQGLLCLQSLISIEVSHCGQLEQVFDMAMAMAMATDALYSDS